MRALTVLVLANLLVWANAQGSTNSSTTSGLSRKDFPSGFIFGAGSAAVQHEGASRIDGKGPNIWDAAAAQGKIKDGSSPDPASDQYHRYKSDVDLMKNLNLDSYRFSISWSRVLPKGRGKPNPQGILYYNNLINRLLSQGITPFVTIYHYDMPQALEDEYGGWLSPKIVPDFVGFAKLCFEEFGDRVKHWVTINELHGIALLSYSLGLHPPFHCSRESGCTSGNPSTEVYLVGHHLLLSHAAGCKLYKEQFQQKQRGKIGITIDAKWYEPLSSRSTDQHAALGEIDTSSDELKEGWLPKTRWKTLAGAEDVDDTFSSIRKHYAPPPSDKHYVGPKNNRPKFLGMDAYEPSNDLECHQFVVVKPADLDIYLVWLGFTISDICKEEGNINLLEPKL